MASKKKTPSKAVKRSSAKAPAMSNDDVSKAVKKLAAKRKISINLSEEQMNEMLRQWSGDPRQPAEITFHVAGKARMRMPVAAYRYAGDTCCV